MAEPIETLYIELQGRLDGLERSLKQAEQRLAQAGQDGGEAFSKGFGSGVEQVITKIGSIGAIVAGGAIGLGAFDGLVRSVFSLAQEADRANTQAQLLSATLERNGISATAAEQSFRATADALGVLPQQLNESSKLLINYGATLDQVAKLQEIGGASALAAGRSAAEGADLIAQAITTENSALLNGIGIASNLSTAYQNYGKEVGKTVEQLTAQEKAQAAVNYLLKETQSEVEALPTLLGGLAGSTNEINQRFTQLRQALGEQLIPIVNAALKGLIGFADILPTLAPAVGVLAAAIGAQRLAGAFSVLNVGVFESIRALGAWAASTVTTTSATTALSTALRGLQAFFLSSPALIIAAGAALITFAQQASSAIRAAEEAALASDRAFNKTESSRIAALRGSSNEIDQLKGRIVALQSALSSIQLGELGGNAEATAAKIKELRQELAALQAEQAKQNNAQATSNDLFKEARTLVENLQKAQDSLSARQIFAAQQAIEAFTKANKDGSAVISAVRAAIAEQNAQLKENEKAAKSATKAVSEWDNYLKSERLEAYRRGIEGMTEAQLRQEVANQRSARAIEQLQAATARLNELQQRRIELERQLAAQAANAPLEQSLAKLDRQYNLGTISAQQYLDAVNALLQAFSKQFASATKGSEEYDRLRGIILRLRDVQESLKDTLEETALAFQRQQASIPLQNTIQSLAESYKAAEITTTDYKNAIDSLLRSESTKFAALEKGTTAYDDQRQIILQLRDIQGELISQLEQETKVRSELQKTISDQANALRVLSESGRVDFLQGVAQQYVELQDLLDRNQVGDRAQQLAADLNNALNSVQIDDATKNAIADLIAAFEELRGQIRIDDIQIPTQFNNFGNLTAEINAEIGTLNTELDTLSSEFKRNAISADEYTIAVNAIIEKFDALSQVARDQANSLQGIGDSAGAIEQLGVVEDIAVKVNELRKSLQNLSQTIKAEQFAPDIADVNLQEGIAALVQRVEELDRAYAKSGTGLEDVQSAIQATIPTLQGYIDLLEEERNLVESRGGKGSAEYEAAAKSIAIAESALASLNATAAKYVQTVEKIADLPIEEFSPAQVFQVAKRVVSELSAELEILTIRFRNGAISSQELQSASAATVARFEGIIAAVRALGDDLLKTGDSVGALERFQLADQAAKQIQQLRDAINETTGAIQKQQEVITIEDTVEALANAYANGTIAIEDYRQAIESLLNSERQQLLSLAKGTDGYNEQKQVVSDLTSIQEKIINLIKQEVEERDKLNKLLVAQAQNQRVLQEAGQEEFVNQIAKQFVELESLLKQNKISDRAYEIANNLQRAFNSVFIDDATRAAIKTLLEDFGALQKQLSQTADGLAIDVPLPRSFFELGNALQLINVALDANDELAKDSAASNQELASAYNEQARQLQDIRANLLAQLAAQRDSNASIDEQATTLRQIAESNRLIDRVSASIDKLRDSYADASAASRLLQDAFEAGFDVPGVYNNIGNAVDQLSTQLENARVLTEQQIIPAEQLTELYRQQLPTLEAIQSALRTQAEALSGNDEAAGQLTQTLQSLGKVDTLINSLNQQLINIAPSSRALRIAQEVTDDWGISLEQLTYGIKQSQDAFEAGFDVPEIYQNIGTAITDTAARLNQMQTAQQLNIITSEELAATYESQLPLLEELLGSLRQQAVALKDNEERAGEYQVALDRVGQLSALIESLNQQLVRIAPSAQAIRIGQEATEDWGLSIEQLIDGIRQSQEAFEAAFNVPDIYQNIGDAIDQTVLRIDTLRGALRNQLITSDDLLASYQEQLIILEDLRQALLTQSDILLKSGDNAEGLKNALNALDKVTSVVFDLNREIVQINPSSQSLRVAQEATESWTVSLDDLSYGIRQVQDAFEASFGVVDQYLEIGTAITALRDQFAILDAQLRRGTISTEDYTTGVQSLINLFGDLEQALLQQGEALNIAGDAAGALERFKAAETVNAQVKALTDSLEKLQEVSARKFAPDLQVVDLEAGIAGIVEQTNALDAAFQKTGEDIFGTADAIRANINILENWVKLREEELNILEQQGDRGSSEYLTTAASVQRAQAELKKLRDVLDGYNSNIRELLTLDLPGEFNVLSGAIGDAEQQVTALGIELRNGTITGEEYRQSLFEIATQIESLVTALNEQRDSIQVVDEASQSAYGNLTTILQQASAALANTTEALRANAAAAIEAGRALRILQETSNEDVTQQVREGLARLEELLSTGVINDEVLQLSDQLSELAGQSLPPDVRQWFNELMQDLSDVRGFLSSNIAETLAYSNANRDLTSSIAQTVDALRRSGERIVTIDDALASFKKFKIEVDSTQLEALRNYLYLTRTDFDDFVQASIEAARQLPQPELVDFSVALEGLGLSLTDLQAIYAETGQSSEEYRTAIIDTIGDLQTFIGVVEELARSYSNAAEESDRVVGAKLAELADRARGKIDDLNDELFRMTEQFKAVNTEIQGFDRETRTLANVQIPDVLPDKDFQALLKSLNVDLGSVEQLGAALSQLPESLRGTGALYQDLTNLVDLTTQGQNKLAEAAGYAQSENQKLGTQIKTLAQDLLVLGTITPEVALGYIELATQIEKIPEAAKKTKSAVDPFQALANLSFENFTQLALALDRVLNPISETGNAADLLQDALREAADGERLLAQETAKVDNEFSRQAATIRDYADQLEATKNVAPDLIKQLRDLALALDVQSLVEEGIKAISFSEEQLASVAQMREALEGINDAAFRQTDTYKVLSDAIRQFDSIKEKSIELTYGAIPSYEIEADRLRKVALSVRALGKEYQGLATELETQADLYVQLSVAAERQREQEELNKKLAAEAQREAEKARRELEQEAERLRREAEARFNQIVSAITGPLGGVVAAGLEKAIFEGLSDSEIEKFVREELTKQLLTGVISAVINTEVYQNIFKDFANELAAAVETGNWQNIGLTLGQKIADGIEIGTRIITDAATTLREVLGDSLTTTANEVEAIANNTASKFANPFENLKPTTLVFEDVFSKQTDSIRKLRQDFEKTVTEEYRSAAGTISGAINSALGNALKQVATGGNREQVRQALRKTLIEGLIAAAIDVAIAQGQLGKLVQDIAASFIGQSSLNLRQALNQIDETVARVLGLFDQFSGDLGSIDLNLGINIGVAVEEIVSDAKTRVQELKEAISGIFQSGISDALFEAVQGGNYEDIKKELDANLKKSIVKVIIDTAVQAALASSAVSVVLANLSKAISAAIRTGDWSQVGAAINQAVSTVSGIMDQLSAQLIPNLSGLFPQQGGQQQIPGFQLGAPTGAGAVPVAPTIQIPGLNETGLAITGAAEGITGATDALITGLTDLELPTVAADFARSTADFRLAVDDLSAILSNNTNWEGVGSR